MKFKKVEKIPEFTLTLNLQEMIDLYRIVRYADANNFETAKPFSELFFDFGANSNQYNHLDWK